MSTMKDVICKNCENYSQDEFDCYKGRIEKDYKLCNKFVKKESAKTMNRKEAVIYLIDNPNKKVRMLKNFRGESNSRPLIMSIKKGKIVKDDDYEFLLYFEDDKSEFEVVRELRKMCYGEAKYHFLKNSTNRDGRANCEKVKSVESGLDYNRAFSKIELYELKGLWTIEGIYEE